MPSGIFGQLPPGARGYLAGEESMNRKSQMELERAKGIFAMQQAQQTQPLQLELLRAQVEQARNPAPIRQDVGNEIQLLHPRTAALLGRIPKGASPDATLREQGSSTRHQIPSGSAALGAETTIRGQDMSARTAQRGQDVTLRGQDLPVWDPERAVFVPQPRGAMIPGASGGQGAPTAAPMPGAIPIPGVKPRAEIKSDADEANRVRETSRTLDAYVSARNGLLSGLGESVTGPLLGRAPAFTSEQQIASGAVSAMAPVLKQLFRVAGEGVFTDRDQALLLDMVPDRKDRPEARREKMNNIDRIVAAKLGMQVPPPPGKPEERSMADQIPGNIRRYNPQTGRIE